jgi:hypothetical protein
MTHERPSLADLTKRYRRAKGTLAKAREALIDGIRAEYADGMKQADIVRAIDHEWTGEQVRKVVTKPPEQA